MHTMKAVFPHFKRSLFNIPATFTKQSVNYLRNNLPNFQEKTQENATQ